MDCTFVTRLATTVVFSTDANSDVGFTACVMRIPAQQSCTEKKQDNYQGEKEDTCHHSSLIKPLKDELL